MLEETSITEKASRGYRPIILALIAIAAALVFGLGGFEQALVRDDAIYVYSGQQMAQGIPPYTSVFDHKGPLSPMLCGFAVALGRSVGIDDVIACRILFFGISILVVVCIFLLAQRVFKCLPSAVFASMTFLTFRGFGVHAASGPRAKTPMVLFEILTLYFTLSRRWFLAGLFGGLATLVWQPMIVYPTISILLAILQSSSNRQRLKNGCLGLCGLLLPVILTTVWFASKGALPEFIEGWITFNVVYLDRGDANIHANLAHMWRALCDGYAYALVPICLGFLGILLFSVTTFTTYRGHIIRWLQEERQAALVLSFPLPFLWSALDFQGYPDFYPFLPYAALGFGWLLSATTTLAKGHYAIRRAFCSLIALALFSVAGLSSYQSRSAALTDQREWAATLNSEILEDDTVISVGNPQAMVLMMRKNPNPYLFVINGIDNYIAAKTDGGFEGWVRDLDRKSPSVVLFGSTRGRHTPKLTQWLRQNYYTSSIGTWEVFRRRRDTRIHNDVQQDAPADAGKPRR